MNSKRVVIVGAGLTGLTLARLEAERGKEVVVLERDERLGGNCRDVYDKETGTYRPLFGPHILHPRNLVTLNWIRRFTDLHPVHYYAKITTDRGIAQFPPNPSTYQMLGAGKMPDDDCLKGVDVDDLSFRTVAIRRFGQTIFDLCFRKYTEDWWGRSVDELPGRLALRIPLHTNPNKVGYYSGTLGSWVPKHGFCHWMAEMHNHPRIQLSLGVSNTEIASVLNQEVTAGRRVWWTGSPDSAFRALGACPAIRLPYRTATWTPFLAYANPEMGWHAQSAPAHHYVAGPHYGVSRYVDYSWLRAGPEMDMASMVLEQPVRADVYDDGEIRLCYPLRGVEDYGKWADGMVSTLESQTTIRMAGRLGTYRYMDMDIAIEDAMTRFAKEEGLKCITW